MGFFAKLKSLFTKDETHWYDEVQIVEPTVESKPTSIFTDIKEPRASFTITGFEEDRIKVEFDWNDAFIKQIRQLGFNGETEEDAVQLFFYMSSMRPTQISEDVVDVGSTDMVPSAGNRMVL